MTPETQLAEALDNLADELLGELYRVRESLKHPKHADQLAPIRADAETVLARFFRRQRRLLLKTLEPALRIVAGSNPNVKEAAGKGLQHFMSADHVRRLREASADDAKEAIFAALPDDYLLPLAATNGMTVDYGKALTSALTAGYDTLAADFAAGADQTISADVTAAYLRERSLEELATQLSGTTVSRLQNALADAYEDGADFDGLVEAVKDEYADMAVTRAQTIAQTGMNSAYNAGRKQLGLDLGFNQKSWSCDGPNPCLVCLANEAEGWIGMEESFSSGDDIPIAHPGCYCSLDVRSKTEAKAA